MATTPNFTKTIRSGTGVLATGDTSRTAPTNAVTIFTAAASVGSRIDRIEVVATGTTTAGMIRLFVHDGTNFRLLQELDVNAVTPSATVRAWKASVTYGSGAVTYTNTSNTVTLAIPGGGLLLPPSHSLRVTTHNTEGFVVIAQGGDFDV